MNEEWRDVPGYEGHYQVSNLGRVKSIKKGREFFMKIRPHTGIRDGKRLVRYMIIEMWRDGVRRKVFIHVLLAQVFIPNPDNLPIVDHRDGNTFNFALSNLQWVTSQENARRWRELKELRDEDKQEVF